MGMWVVVVTVAGISNTTEIVIDTGEILVMDNPTEILIFKTNFLRIAWSQSNACMIVYF